MCRGKAGAVDGGPRRVDSARDWGTQQGAPTGVRGGSVESGTVRVIRSSLYNGQGTLRVSGEGRRNCARNRSAFVIARAPTRGAPTGIRGGSAELCA